MGCNTMAFLTLSEAASIVGVNKATLWRAVKQGRLSAHREADKPYRIEESELLRVFPDAGKQQAGNSDSLDLPSHATLQIDTLKTQIELLQRQLEDMQRDKQWLMQRIETLEATQQRMLPLPRQGLIERIAEAVARPKGNPEWFLRF